LEAYILTSWTFGHILSYYHVSYSLSTEIHPH